METIIIDTREKPKAISGILKFFESQNIKYISSKLYVGDYQLLDNPKLVIDRKNGLGEVCSNIIQDHERFRNELIRANEVGIKVIILVATNDDKIAFSRHCSLYGCESLPKDPVPDLIHGSEFTCYRIEYAHRRPYTKSGRQWMEITFSDE